MYFFFFLMSLYNVLKGKRNTDETVFSVYYVCTTRTRCNTFFGNNFLKVTCLVFIIVKRTRWSHNSCC